MKKVIGIAFLIVSFLFTSTPVMAAPAHNYIIDPLTNRFDNLGDARLFNAAGDIDIDAFAAAADTTVNIRNSDAGQVANLVVEGTITATSGFVAPGADTQVIYNNSGILAGDTGMTYDSATDIFTVAHGTLNENPGIFLETYSTSGADYSRLRLRHSLSNTLGTMVETTNGVILGSTYFEGVNSSSGYTAGGRIYAYQVGAAGATYIGGTLVLGGADSTTGTWSTLYLSDDDKVGIRVADPTVAFDMLGDALITGGLTVTGTIDGASFVSDIGNSRVVYSNSGTLEGDSSLIYNSLTNALTAGLVHAGGFYGYLYLNDDVGVFAGTGNDSKIYYDAANLIIDPDLVGTGKVLIGATGDDDLQAATITATTFSFDATEYIDQSSGDGWVDIFAATGIEMHAAVWNTGDLYTAGTALFSGDLYFEDAGTGLPYACAEGIDETVDCGAAESWQQVTFDTAGPENLAATSVGDNEIEVTYAGIYQVSVIACFNSNPAHDFELMVKKTDGTVDLMPHLFQTTAVANKTENTSGTCLVTLAASDRVELWVSCRSGANIDAVFDHVSLALVMVGG